MCILCGELMEDIHWSELDLNNDSKIRTGDYQRERQRSRLLRTEIAKKILSVYGLQIKEWNNSRYILTNGRGKTEVVTQMNQIWDKASQILGHPVDPLDSRVIESLKSNE